MNPAVNGRRVILPVVVCLITASIAGIIFQRIRNQSLIEAKSLEIGYELIRETNSSLVVTVGSGLKDRLSNFLSYPAKIERVTLGDEPAPVGDGQASSQLWLINEHNERIVIRLHSDKVLEKFDILGYWTPVSGPDDPKH